MREELHRLLQAHESQSSLLDAQCDWQQQLHRSFQAPEHIGEYRIRRPLGSGGLGEVYLAEKQQHGVEHTVAIKFATAGRYSPHVLNSFMNELNILLNLNHPNIERLFEGGVTDDGVPYLVVEYIRGHHLDAHCDAERLNLRARLRLFHRICLAVDAMHRALIIHRDIKPGNIMVNEQGQPKLLDFGLAKLTDSESESVGGTKTLSGDMMTLAYASPEQITGAGMTTATDIYSLGLVLHVLLTGQLPYHFDHHNLAEASRTITEHVPRMASRQILADSVIAQTEPQLERLLRGDLNCIVAQALEKAPERRYASARALADDIERHLTHQPVKARPDAWLYVWRKFMRRHWMSVGVGAVAVLSLISLSVVLSVRSHQLQQSLSTLRQQQLKVLRVTDFLKNIFSLADPLNGDVDLVKVTDLLDHSSKQLANRFNQDPGTKATLYLTLGQVYLNLSKLPEAEALLLQALPLQREENDAAGVAETTLQLARVRQLQARYDDAEKLLDEIPASGPTALQHAVQFQRGSLQLDRGDYPAAAKTLGQLLQTAQSAGGSDAAMLASAHRHYGNVLWRLGDLDAARSHYRSAHRIDREVHGETHHLTLQSLSALGLAAYAQGDYATALQHFQTVVDARIASLGVDHLMTAEALNRLGSIHYDMGHHAQADAVLSRARGIYERLNLERSNGHSSVLINLGLVRKEQRQHAQAEALFKRALSIDREVLGPEHPNLATTLNNLGLIAADQDRFSEALTLFREAHDLLHRHVGLNNARIAFPMNNMGRMHLQLGQLDEAQRWIDAALTLRREKLGVNNLQYAESLSARAEIDLAKAAWSSAAQRLSEALSIRQQQLPADDWHLAETRLLLHLAEQPHAQHTDAALRCWLDLLAHHLGQDHHRVRGLIERLPALQALTCNHTEVPAS